MSQSLSAVLEQLTYTGPNLSGGSSYTTIKRQILEYASLNISFYSDKFFDVDVFFSDDGNNFDVISSNQYDPNTSNGSISVPCLGAWTKIKITNTSVIATTSIRMYVYGSITNSVTTAVFQTGGATPHVIVDSGTLNIDTLFNQLVQINKLNFNYLPSNSGSGGPIFFGTSFPESLLQEPIVVTTYNPTFDPNCFTWSIDSNQKFTLSSSTPSASFATSGMMVYSTSITEDTPLNVYEFSYQNLNTLTSGSAISYEHIGFGIPTNNNWVLDSGITISSIDNNVFALKLWNSGSVALTINQTGWEDPIPDFNWNIMNWFRFILSDQNVIFQVFINGVYTTVHTINNNIRYYCPTKAARFVMMENKLSSVTTTTGLSTYGFYSYADVKDNPITTFGSYGMITTSVSSSQTILFHLFSPYTYGTKQSRLIVKFSNLIAYNGAPTSSVYVLQINIYKNVTFSSNPTFTSISGSNVQASSTSGTVSSYSEVQKTLILGNQSSSTIDLEDMILLPGDILTVTGVYTSTTSNAYTCINWKEYY